MDVKLTKEYIAPRLLRGAEGLRGGEVTAGWVKLHNEELHNL
jgi:hypothetical protein